MAPEWEKFLEYSKSSSDYKVMDIDCDLERVLCKELDGLGTPTIIWYSNITKRFIVYDGYRTASSIKAFVLNQLGGLIEVNESYISELEQSQETTFFVFRFPKEDRHLIGIFKKIEETFRASSVSLYLVDTPVRTPLCTIYQDSSHKSNYSGDWNSNDLIEFIADALLYQEKRLTNETMKMAYDYNVSLLVATYKGSVVPSIGYSSRPYFTLNCSDIHSSRLCYHRSDIPLDWVLFSPKLNKFWYNHQEVIEDKWLASIKKGELKSIGPGVGVFSQFRSLLFVIPYDTTGILVLLLWILVSVCTILLFREEFLDSRC